MPKDIFHDAVKAALIIEKTIESYPIYLLIFDPMTNRIHQWKN